MSDLRQDLVSGDWIISAPERAKRPHDILPELKERRRAPKRGCPFEDLKKSGNWPPIYAYPNEKKWEIAVVPNKYPALKKHDDLCAQPYYRGPYKLEEGIGYHDLVITRDHDKNIADISLDKAVQLFLAFQRRYRILKEDKCVSYTSTFFNWGASVGASIYHPHYQMLTLPIIPPDINHSLFGSKNFFKKHRKCVHCVMLSNELREIKRIVEENKGAVSIAPFVSREPYEIRVFPKKHLPYFEETPVKDLRDTVSILQSSIKRVKKYLNDPDFNFFIHTAPLKSQHHYKHYHWHIEILPKIKISAGFELSTGVEINVVDPDKAAAILRGENV